MSDIYIYWPMPTTTIPGIAIDPFDPNANLLAWHTAAVAEAVKNAVAAERERCAKIAENEPVPGYSYGLERVGFSEAKTAIFTAIMGRQPIKKPAAEDAFDTLPGERDAENDGKL